MRKSTRWLFTQRTACQEAARWTVSGTCFQIMSCFLCKTETITSQHNPHIQFFFLSTPLLLFLGLSWIEDVSLVEFMYLVFTCMPGENYHRHLRSLMLYLCYIFWVLINSLVCWFSSVLVWQNGTTRMHSEYHTNWQSALSHHWSTSSTSNSRMLNPQSQRG